VNTSSIPEFVSRVLARLTDVRPTRGGWDAQCPCADHNPSSSHPGDQHPSLHVGIGGQGQILLKCRVGCKTDAVLQSLGLGWSDLFPPDDQTPSAEQVPDEQVPHEPDRLCCAGLLHAAYTAVVQHLELSEPHRHSLRGRGLSDEFIQRAEYRTLRHADRRAVATAVGTEIGPDLCLVPGFTNGESGPTLSGEATGLVIPVRDLSGRIRALKLRQDRHPKYVYLSDGASGRSSGSPVHVPLGTPSSAETVRVTEGELKADVCRVLDSTPTVGIPGVTNWQAALPVLRELGAREVVIAFDAPDVHHKAPVFQQLAEFAESVEANGLELTVEDWDDNL